MPIKRLLSILSIIIVSQFLKAQTSYSIKAGYTIAWPDYGDANLPADAEIDVHGYNISLLIYRKLSSTISIGLEPGIVQRGSQCFPGWQPIFLGDTKVNISMLELPVMLRKYHRQDKLDLALKIGYGVSIATVARETLTPSDPSKPIVRRKVNLNDPNLTILTYDHGAYGGMEFGYFLSNRHRIFFDANLYLGILNIDKNNYAKNRSLSFSLGYTIAMSERIK